MPRFLLVDNSDDSLAGDSKDFEHKRLQHKLTPVAAVERLLLLVHGSNAWRCVERSCVDPGEAAFRVYAASDDLVLHGGDSFAAVLEIERLCKFVNYVIVK